MTIIATLVLQFRPETLDDARRVTHRVLEQTRDFDGNEGVDVLVNRDDQTRWTVVETWTSPEHDAAYRRFRAGPGAVTDLAPLLSAPPQLTWFTLDSTI